MTGFWDGRVYRGDDSNERPTGGDDDETLLGAGGDDTLTGGGGDDVVKGGDGNDILSGESVDGGDGRDIVNIESGRGEFIGGNGNDLFLYAAFTPPDAQVDMISGGNGDDTLSFALTSTKFSISSGAVEIDGEKVAAISGIENFEVRYFGGMNIAIALGDGDDKIESGTGDDKLTGGDGDDGIEAGAGSDTVSGGTGVDYVELDIGGKDKVDLGDGSDVLRATGLGGGFGNYDGGAGFDLLELFLDVDLAAGQSLSFDDGVLKLGSKTVVTAAKFEAYSFRGPEVGNYAFTGGAEVDTAIGGAGDQTFKGAAGDDFLDGDAGSDKLFGDAGDARAARLRPDLYGRSSERPQH